MNRPAPSGDDSRTQSSRARVRALIGTTFPAAGRIELADADSLFETGIVDSMGVLDIVGFLESEFSISPTDDEMIADNFESIETIAAFVDARQGVARSQG